MADERLTALGSCISALLKQNNMLPNLPISLQQLDVYSLRDPGLTKRV